jgi:hypothetical protein
MFVYTCHISEAMTEQQKRSLALCNQPSLSKRTQDNYTRQYVLLVFRYNSNELNHCLVSSLNSAQQSVLVTNDTMDAVESSDGATNGDVEDEDEEEDDGHGIGTAMRALVFLNVVPAKLTSIGIPVCSGGTGVHSLGVQCAENDIAFAMMSTNDTGRAEFRNLIRAGIDFGFIRCHVQESATSREAPHFVALLKRQNQWLLIDGANNARVGLLHRNRVEDVLFSTQGRNAICNHIRGAFPGGCRFDESPFYPFLIMPKQIKRPTIVHECVGNRLPDSVSHCYLARTPRRSVPQGASVGAAAVNVHRYSDLLDGNNRWLHEIRLPN